MPNRGQGAVGAESVSLEAAIRANNRVTAFVVEVRGELALLPSQGPPTTWRVSLLVSRAGGLRLIAEGGSGDFEMASDGSGVWVRSSGDGLVALAPAVSRTVEPGRSWLALDPFLLADALLPRHLPDVDTAGESLLFERRHDESVVGWLRRAAGGFWAPQRRVGVMGDRLVWVESFGQDATLRARTDYSGASLPEPGFVGRVEIRQHGSRIVLRVTSVDLAPPISADTFRLR